MENLLDNLKEQNIALIEGSLGLQHLFRELSQIYEAVKHHSNQQHAVDCYPKIMVEILNKGNAIELMDGDASHVPIVWVSAILDQLKDFYKGKTVFVVSVLGIQSTGKSTLLNTMFGLQFNVSAGRCTRGAFMQLLPVQSNSKSMCDYVLIIDTEGLRAPELSVAESYFHDNELATFVIGLADVAIINIYGETPADLNDILQTAIHAFIRMKNVSVNLSCHFVHQNVTTVLVDNKITFGEQTFLDKLNEMTKYAAIAEHCEGKYTSFQDVIKFDGKKDITYFPGLWKGDPPMAPINSGYSDKALQLKSSIMSLAEFKIKEDPSFDSFQLLLQALWSAVCRENYIFSFKNTKEAVAYNKLDAAFSQWSWTLHQKMLDWQHQTGNAISNCAPTKVSAAVTTCLKRADNMLQETSSKLKEEMKNFFEKSEHSDTLAQWKSKYIKRFEYLKDDSKKEAKRQCDILKFNRLGRIKLENIQKDYRTQLLQNIQQLVMHSKRNKTKLRQSELERKFDEKWQSWIRELSTEDYENLYISNKEIQIQISDCLKELLNSYDSILIPKLQKTNLSQQAKHGLYVLINPSKHLKLNQNKHSMPHPVNKHTSALKRFTVFLGFGKDKRELREEGNLTIIDAQNVSDVFLNAAINEFCKIKNSFHNFHRAHAFNPLKEFIDKINTYNKEHEYMFTSEYVVDMAIAFANYMTTEFIKLMDKIKTDNNPMVSLKRLRETYFNTFVVQYKDASGEDLAAKNLCHLLSVSIETAVEQILPTKIAAQMRDSDPSFRQKTHFRVKILTDLATEKSLSYLKSTLQTPKAVLHHGLKDMLKTFAGVIIKQILKA